ncbi:uncharacterized protein N7511_006316 [Penicillium nucicola]|uniref:uncharacterized protein n=1 Tax=Penicillium nucicola TaxID=1850975 RepID=UPI00254535D1|nr:uncharacterized protein N7511_006316 [Penicillium nucicola]KAJ5757622.1 hypothetical protein N7511_006316 [Penicillium nucicola]
MDALLALTSLHLATELSAANEEKIIHLSDALQYQSSAVPAFRTALEDISAANCDALFACSVLMMACTVVFPSLETHSRGGASSGRKVPTDLSSLFQFVKGIHSVIDQARPSLDSGPFKLVITPYLGIEQMYSSTSEVILPSTLKKLCHDEPSVLQDIYIHAVEMLERCAMAEGMVVPWIVMAGERFVEQVEKEEPLALLVYICWGALFGRLEEMWWARVAGQTIVMNLSECIVKNEESDEIVRWAKEKVGIKP